MIYIFLVLRHPAGSCLPTSPFISVLCSSLHLIITTNFQLIQHANGSSTSWFPTLHSFFTNFLQQAIPLNTCPIQFFLCIDILSTNDLSSSTSCNTSTF